MAVTGGSPGTIRTMANDLALEKGEKPRKIEVPQATPPAATAPAESGGPLEAMAGGAKPINTTPQVQGITPPRRPSPPMSRQTKEPPKAPLSQKTLEELLPLEEPLSTTREETIDQTKIMPQQPQQKSQLQQENPPEREAYKPTQSSPEPTPSDDLKKEVFPAPDIKKDFTKPPPPPPNLPGVKEKESEESREIDTDAEVPTETPEELLGIGEDEETPGEPAAPTPPPAPADSGAPPKAVAGGPIEAEKSLDESEGKDKTPIARRFIMIGGATLVLLLIAGGIFYYTSLPGEGPPTPQPQPQPEPSQTTFVPPAPLITPDFVQEIILEDFEKETLTAALNTLAFNQYPDQSITYLPVRLSQANAEGEGQYLNGPLFFQNFGIQPPEELLEKIESRFMLYIYGPTNEEENLCKESGITDSSCWGPRLGFILQAKEKTANLSAGLDDWIQPENTNLTALILSDAQRETEALTQLTTTYEGLTIQSPRTIEVYYNNFPISSMTFDYAFVDDLLIFATSKNALFFMLDKVMQE